MPHISRSTWLYTKDYLFIIFGIALYAVGFNAFVLPHNVVMGGMAGIGSIVYYATSAMKAAGTFPFAIPVGYTVFAVNIILLIIAWKALTKTFVIRTVFGFTVLMVMLNATQPLFPEAVMPDFLVSLIIGAIVMGTGIGLVFVHNGSTGGTDIVAAMVAKHTNVSIGRTMMMCDVFIVSSGCLVLDYSFQTAVYGMMITVFCGYMCDLVINSNRQAVQFIIFSKKWEEIATAINNDAHRGCTVINGMGWYSKQEVKVLLVMCRKIESVTIFRIIKSIDRDALVTQANVNGVYGQGFDELKLKMKPPKAEEANA
ncbi:MAG: YitT family protein [Muribaculaceae bacterium]|nr:YitT family protein [Muribaculaceae bacterium]